ncbi:MAG: hypothetical protein ACRDH6_09875 [Actinomycetota bacterium]
MLDVLIVCTGNICRSPIAEGIFVERSKRLLDGAVRVSSAGTWAVPGREPMPEAVGVARELGVDIGALESTRVSEELLERSDLVLTMTQEQRDEIIALVPTAAAKTFTLKELAALLDPMGAPSSANRTQALAQIAEAHRRRTEETVTIADDEITDPLGLSIAAYRAVASEIANRIDALVHLLFGIPLEAIDPVKTSAVGE